MTKGAYGIPVPRGVRQDWKAQPERSGYSLHTHRVPGEWGNPAKCVIWYDRFNRRRLIVAHYANGRSATVRIDANGVWKTVFGEVE